MSDTEPAVIIKDLYKSFKLPHEQHSGIKQGIINVFKGVKGYETQKVLNDISFEVKKGDFFGIVGRNGSGKSTLLKLIASIYTPDKGSIKINGSLTPFIELGVGFNPELTGRENIFLNGALLGFSRIEIGNMYDDIVGFAELEKFMDQKLKNYSSGMQVRLAFSIAIQAKSDILMLDEVLAVGDVIFQQKCFKYFGELKSQKKTILLVSHDINVLRQYCNRGVLIEGGNKVIYGDINMVTDKYVEIISEQESKQRNNSKKQPVNKRGTGKASIEGAGCYGVGGKKNTFVDNDEHITIKANYHSNTNINSPVYGVVINDQMGEKIFSSNNVWLNIKSKDLEKGDYQEVEWKLPNVFNNGEYSVTLAIADENGKEIYEEVNDILLFGIRKRNRSSALINPKHEMIIR